MFESMVTSIADAGRELLYGGRKPLLQSKSTMLELCHSLLGQKGEALGTALAREVLDRYQGYSDEDKAWFFQTLKGKFEPDSEKLRDAIQVFLANSSAENRLKLERVVETPRQHLIRALNMAPDGTVALVQMRKDLQAYVKDDPSLKVVDAAQVTYIVLCSAQSPSKGKEECKAIFVEVARLSPGTRIRIKPW